MPAVYISALGCQVLSNQTYVHSKWKSNDARLTASRASASRQMSADGSSFYRPTENQHQVKVDKSGTLALMVRRVLWQAWSCLHCGLLDDHAHRRAHLNQRGDQILGSLEAGPWEKDNPVVQTHGQSHALPSHVPGPVRFILPVGKLQQTNTKFHNFKKDHDIQTSKLLFMLSMVSPNNGPLRLSFKKKKNVLLYPDVNQCFHMWTLCVLPGGTEGSSTY